MTTTTDPTALLAEAAAKVWIEDVPMGVPESIAQAILAASPALSRALAIGTAWLAAEEALPEAGELQLMLTTWVGREPLYEAVYESQRQQYREAARRNWHEATDPATALLALADALRKERGA